jgi:hypothetical protein
MEERMENNACKEIKELAAELMDCRNELCLKCGRYHDRHMGACDGCRWKDMDKWKS